MKKTTWISALAFSMVMAAAAGCTEAPSAATTQAAVPAVAEPVQAPTTTQAPATGTAPSTTQAPAGPGAVAAQPPTCSTVAAETHAPAGPAAGAGRAEASTRRTTKDAAPVKVKRLVLTEDIEGREPTRAMTSFTGAEARKIYAFVEVENPSAASSEITVTFEPPDGSGARGHVTLDVGAAHRWRTWAFTRSAKVAGSWTAVVHGPRGEELARAPFEVTL
ncbi:DUF2914 domain-containing protein [Chondromyces apiculatus]|nr:DUF2914 domain-containing protein [Chondromyces apiculatus]